MLRQVACAVGVLQRLVVGCGYCELMKRGQRLVVMLSYHVD